MPDYDYDALDQSVETPRAEVIVPCEDISGIAGTGKTFHCVQKIADDPSWGTLCATTGIAAVNLGTTTLNSTLGFFDTDSLKDAYLEGRLQRRLHDLGRDTRRLVIDERSMLDATQLDLLYRGMQQANDYADVKQPMGITLVGDFAQLPPVRARFCFEAECWPEFAAHTTRLTKVWRQEQAGFLSALNAARRGDGESAAQQLSTQGLEWHTALDTEFQGTTLVPKNDQVDRYNMIALDRVHAPKFYVQSRRWGKLRPEWAGIPQRAEFKPGAYVMILSNAPLDRNSDDPSFEYVNGDCGWIEEHHEDSISIRLARGDRTISLPRIVRSVTLKDKPYDWPDRAPVAMDANEYLPHCHVTTKRRYVIGQVEYFPLRLAYASTVHKSQGLTLDRLQIDIRNNFFGQPAMAYVALSRCRTLEGLRIVGMREVFVKHSKADPRVKEWL